MSMTDREFLRHTVATLAYRAGKALRGAPPTFASFRPGPSSKSAAEILAHMGDLFDWALSMAEGTQRWKNSTSLPWDQELDRFFRTLQAFDDYLASDNVVHHDLSRLFQGPVADALTHTGQIAQLRRLHGSPIKGENYSRADIVVGRVGFDQTPANPKNEFD
jgi:hypothetical protein